MSNRSSVSRLLELAEQTNAVEVTHREIFDRLIAMEVKVDKIETNTAGIVAAFNAAQGAFTVLEWLTKVAKPLLWIGALGTAAVTVWESLKAK